MSSDLFRSKKQITCMLRCVLIRWCYKRKTIERNYTNCWFFLSISHGNVFEYKLYAIMRMHELDSKQSTLVFIFMFSIFFYLVFVLSARFEFSFPFHHCSTVVCGSQPHSIEIQWLCNWQNAKRREKRNASNYVINAHFVSAKFFNVARPYFSFSSILTAENGE